MFLTEMLHSVSHGIWFKHTDPLQNKITVNKNGNERSVKWDKVVNMCLSNMQCSVLITQKEDEFLL